jgi:hypothetical protein
MLSRANRDWNPALDLDPTTQTPGADRVSLEGHRLSPTCPDIDVDAVGLGGDRAPACIDPATPPGQTAIRRAFAPARALHIDAIEATMRTAKQRRTDALSDDDLQAINAQMLRATWEAGLPTAAGVAEALAERRRRRTATQPEI